MFLDVGRWSVGVAFEGVGLGEFGYVLWIFDYGLLWLSVRRLGCLGCVRRASRGDNVEV